MQNSVIRNYHKNGAINMTDEELITVNSLWALTTKGIRVVTNDGEDLTEDLKEVYWNDGK